jgi:membrane protease YdiL (CAAX protease family)
MNNEGQAKSWTVLLRQLCTDNSALVLVSVSVLLTIYRYYGSAEFYTSHLVQYINCGNVDTFCSSLYSFLCALLLLMAVPVIVVKYFLRLDAKSVGLRWGDWRRGFKTVAILFPIAAVLLLYPTSKMESFRAVYPLFRSAGEGIPLLILYEILYGGYYLAWEFFFRGYMLFSLKDRFGELNSILIQTIPSVLMHIGKPDGEIFASFVAGIAFGIIALRTRSIVYVFLLHWLIGITLDLFIIYG